MTGNTELLLAIRAGRLSRVVRLLDQGVPLDDPDDGEPGFLLGMACFLGHVDIVRELARRGAVVNLPDNGAPTSPLSMAVRGGHKEVVRALVELGVEPPAGMACGLSEHEVTLAKWIAFRDGRLAESAPPPEVHAVEEIDLQGCSGTDTMVLESEALRLLGDKMR